MQRVVIYEKTKKGRSVPARTRREFKRESSSPECITLRAALRLRSVAPACVYYSYLWTADAHDCLSVTQESVSLGDTNRYTTLSLFVFRSRYVLRRAPKCWPFSLMDISAGIRFVCARMREHRCLIHLLSSLSSSRDTLFAWENVGIAFPDVRLACTNVFSL